MKDVTEIGNKNIYWGDRNTELRLNFTLRTEKLRSVVSVEMWEGISRTSR